MANNILLDKASSLQYREFVFTNENKENTGEEKSILEHNVSDCSLDESNALGRRYGNGQNIKATCENEKTSCNSNVSSICCDICGRHFRKISSLIIHHFICIKTQQIEYADCDKPFSDNDGKIHMCKHLCLNESPGKLHPNLISETNVNLNGKSDSFVSEIPVEVVKNGECGGSIADDDGKIHMCKHLCLNESLGKLHPNLISETNVHLNDKSDSFVYENPVEVVKNGECGGSVADDDGKIHMCKHLCLNERPGKFYPNLISETNVHLNGKSDSFVSEIPVEVVKNGECGGSVADDEVLLSENVSNQNGVLENNIVESVMKESNMQNLIIKNVLNCSNAEKPIVDTSPVIEPSVSELECDICDVLEVVQDIWYKKFKWPLTPDVHQHSYSNNKPYSFSESDRHHSFSEMCRKKRNDIHHSEILLKQKNIIYNIDSAVQSTDIHNTEIEKVCYSNNDKFVDHNSSGTKPSVSELTCNICGQNFTSQSNLNTHHHTHTNNELNKCIECGKQFSSLSNLKRHLRIHTMTKKLSVSELTCDIYGQEFTSQSNLDTHHHTRTNYELYNCMECGKQFSRNDSLKRHLRIHTMKKTLSDSELTGDICGQKFPSQSNLDTHHHTHTNFKLYNCTECGKQFSRIDNFKAHLRIHTRKRPNRCKRYTCKICLRSFAFQARLNFHLRIHANAREFKCTLCDKGFNQKSTLAGHMLTHSDEKLHKCSICNKRFTFKTALRRHIQRHSGVKPHQCDVCLYKFTFIGELKKHYRKHTGELPFKCDICEKRFRHRSGLNGHVAAHTGNQPHECDICQKKFFHKYALTSHRRVHTQDKIFACNICDKSFRTKIGLKSHHQVHTGEKPFVCSYCNKTFANRGALDRHVLIHTGTKPYECKICKRFFNQKPSLQRHQVVHTKEKPYSCDICEKSFTQKSYLSIHKLKHSKDKP